MGLSIYSERLVIEDTRCTLFSVPRSPDDYEMDEYQRSDMMILQLLEPAYGHMINKDELVFRNDAEIIAAAALGMPVEFPTLTDDPEECKKVVTEYFRRLYGVGLYNLCVKHRLAREAASPPHNPIGEGPKASAGSDESTVSGSDEFTVSG